MRLDKMTEAVNSVQAALAGLQPDERAAVLWRVQESGPRRPGRPPKVKPVPANHPEEIERWGQ